MPVIAVGLNHKTAPISLLGELSVSADDLPKALHQLATYEHVLEGAVLSTCNRSEVYAFVTKFHGGAQDLRNFLAEFCHVAPEEFNDHLYTYHDDAAARHLFRVAAGIDSMIVGESEILGQVKHAYQVAGDDGMIHRVLGRAFQQALKVGKEARTDTSIGRNPVSVSSAAVELARRAFGGDSLRDKRVLIVGAGKMGHLAMRSLAHAGATDVAVVNRTQERALSLAEAYGATPMSFDQLERAVGAADIVISSTTSPESVIDRPMIERAVGTRARDLPLMIIDIAVPADVE
nr:glutamyl-tRNA reductase [Actinomycetota bacterium]